MAIGLCAAPRQRADQQSGWLAFADPARPLCDSPTAEPGRPRLASLRSASPTWLHGVQDRPTDRAYAPTRPPWLPAYCDRPRFLLRASSDAQDPQLVGAAPTRGALAQTGHPRALVGAPIEVFEWPRWQRPQTARRSSDYKFSGNVRAPLLLLRSGGRQAALSVLRSDQRILQNGTPERRIYSRRVASGSSDDSLFPAWNGGPPTASECCAPDRHTPPPRRCWLLRKFLEYLADFFSSSIVSTTGPPPLQVASTTTQRRIKDG